MTEVLAALEGNASWRKLVEAADRLTALLGDEALTQESVGLIVRGVSEVYRQRNDDQRWRRTAWIAFGGCITELGLLLVVAEFSARYTAPINQFTNEHMTALLWLLGGLVTIAFVLLFQVQALQPDISRHHPLRSMTIRSGILGALAVVAGLAISKPWELGLAFPGVALVVAAVWWFVGHAAFSGARGGGVGATPGAVASK